MKIMVITSSPNKEGLTESCGAAAKKGIEKGNGEAIMVRLNDLNILKRIACDQGWGICLKVINVFWRMISRRCMKRWVKLKVLLL